MLRKKIQIECLQKNYGPNILDSTFDFETFK